VPSDPPWATATSTHPGDTRYLDATSGNRSSTRRLTPQSSHVEIELVSLLGLERRLVRLVTNKMKRAYRTCAYRDSQESTRRACGNRARQISPPLFCSERWSIDYCSPTTNQEQWSLLALSKRNCDTWVCLEQDSRCWGPDAECLATKITLLTLCF
jgi:hypothetical protein